MWQITRKVYLCIVNNNIYVNLRLSYITWSSDSLQKLNSYGITKNSGSKMIFKNINIFALKFEKKFL